MEDDKLTKEYIEDFGWVRLNGFYYEFPIKNEICVDEFSNRPLDFRFNFVSDDRYVMLEAYERNGFEWEFCYRGKCSTIEEFNWLMNQFNIKRIEFYAN